MKTIHTITSRQLVELCGLARDHQEQLLGMRIVDMPAFFSTLGIPSLTKSNCRYILDASGLLAAWKRSLESRRAENKRTRLSRCADAKRRYRVRVNERLAACEATTAVLRDVVRRLCEDLGVHYQAIQNPETNGVVLCPPKQ